MESLGLPSLDNIYHIAFLPFPQQIIANFYTQQNITCMWNLLLISRIE